MDILTELTEVFTEMDIAFETGTFSDNPPGVYVVILPLRDTFDVHSDNTPKIDRQTAQLIICSKGNPYQLRNKIVGILLKRNFTILNREYAGYGADTEQHVMLVDVEGCYPVDLGADDGND